MKQVSQPPVALSIAGSDSGGGAGIQADLAAFRTFGCFATSAITAITAQNPGGVTGVQAVEAEILAAQILAVLEAFPVAAAKTGMLWGLPQMEAFASIWQKQTIPLVVDPVMVATSGARLLQSEAEAFLKEKICPLADLVTPNLEEAAVLLGKEIKPGSVSILEAARKLAQELQVSVLLKGGHGESNSDLVEDFLVTDQGLFVFRSPRIGAQSPHGTGCTLAAGITANLAQGKNLLDAIGWAKGLVNAAISSAVPSKKGPSVSTLVSLENIKPVEAIPIS